MHVFQRYFQLIFHNILMNLCKFQEIYETCIVLDIFIDSDIICLSISCKYTLPFPSILCSGPPDAPKHRFFTYFTLFSPRFHLFHLFPYKYSKACPECKDFKGIFKLYTQIILWNPMGCQKIPQNSMNYHNMH